MLSTVGGTLVAGALVYMVHASMRDQTQFMVTSMHAEADGLAEANDYDKSTGQRSHNATRSSFHPAPPSFWDEVKARWNSHLTQTLQGASMPAAPAQQRGARAAPVFLGVERTRRVRRRRAAEDRAQRIGGLARRRDRIGIAVGPSGLT